MDDTNLTNPQGVSANPGPGEVTPPPPSPLPPTPTVSTDPVVATSSPSDIPIASPPDFSPPQAPSSSVVPPASNHNNSYKIFIIIGIILTLLAGIGIAGTAIATYISRSKNAENQTMKVPSIAATPTIVTQKVTTTQMVKEIVLSDEDPTRPGVPVLKKNQFAAKTESIYATIVLNQPIVQTNISYVRYLNSNYIDHGTIIITKPDSKYVHFNFNLLNSRSVHSLGTYVLKIYVDGQIAKTISYDVIN